MVVGSPAALKELGEQLTRVPIPEDRPMPPGWPPEVAAPEVVGPYKDIPDFSLSFHVHGDKPSVEVLPLTRRAMPTPFFFVVAALTVVGAVTVIRWVLGYAF